MFNPLIHPFGLCHINHTQFETSFQSLILLVISHHYHKLRIVDPVCLSPLPLFVSDLPFLSSGSIKGRRSSYLLAITTERSKSCDEGLNTFREEGHVFS